MSAWLIAMLCLLTTNRIQEHEQRTNQSITIRTIIQIKRAGKTHERIVCGGMSELPLACAHCLSLSAHLPVFARPADTGQFMHLKPLWSSVGSDVQLPVLREAASRRLT